MSLTPEQFNKLATKEDLKELKQEMATKEDINKILTAVDGVAKKHQNFEVEMAANVGAHERFEKKFIKTNKRVKVLEKELSVSQVVI
ncbi:MAG: hypothetical protein HYV53_01095 [Parcubacteria group bacterium]|nr:hypothetical protein [Parcubacteria group bacterium]